MLIFKYKHKSMYKNNLHIFFTFFIFFVNYYIENNNSPINK